MITSPRSGAVRPTTFLRALGLDIYRVAAWYALLSCSGKERCLCTEVKTQGGCISGAWKGASWGLPMVVGTTMCGVHRGQKKLNGKEMTMQSTGPITTIALAASPKLNPHRRHRASPEGYPLGVPPSQVFCDGVSARRRAFFVPARKSLHSQAWHARREVSGICRHSWGLWGAPGHTRHGALPNRIPEAAPYNGTEAKASPLPYEDKWITITHPRLCASCHPQIFQEWHGSRMANSWHDPGWRGARGIPVCRWAGAGYQRGRHRPSGARRRLWGRLGTARPNRRSPTRRCQRQRIQRAHEGGREARERALHKNACTCCCPARRHGWDSAGLQTPVQPSGQHPATGRCLVAGISGLLSFSSWHR